MSVKEQNIASLTVVAKGLAELAERVAFVGGATIALYVDDQGAADARITKDVDAVIELAGYTGFALLEARLRQLGFVNVDEPNAPICRWRFKGILVDIMPTDPAILGFSNRWYADAMAQRRKVEIAPGVSIFLFPLAYIIATKLEAFAQRGRGDWLASNDLEDVVALFDGATEIAAELAATQGELRAYLRTELAKLLRHPAPDQVVMAHLTPDAAIEHRAERVMRLIAAFVGI